MKRATKSAVAALAALALLAASCAKKTIDTSDKESGLAAACAADVTITEAFIAFLSSAPEPEDEGPPSAEYLAEFQKAFDEQVAGPLADFESKAPEEISAEVKTVVAAVRSFRGSADGSVMNTDEFISTGTKIDKFFYGSCGDTTAEVAGVDYEFTGAPSSAKPGVLRILFSNKGKDSHELLIFTKAPGVAESFDEIFAMEEGAEEKVKLVGATDAEPGESRYASANLKAGEYLFICFIPQGSVGDTEGEGPPHFTLGMKQELKVE